MPPPDVGLTMAVKDWNNQIRAANAALALKAHREAKERWV